MTAKDREKALAKKANPPPKPKEDKKVKKSLSQKIQRRKTLVKMMTRLMAMRKMFL